MPNHNYEAETKWLRKRDPVLGSVIERVGPCELTRQGGTFALLARSILSQQISVAAAATIRRRLLDQLPARRLTAQALVDLPEERLIAAGVSNQKRRYLLDLAARVTSGEINFRRLAKIPDQEVIDTLVKVKGIGVWTAQMFLMFGLGRPDIFAPDDLGLRNAIIRLYNCADPNKQALQKIAETWSPHRSIASWYLWRSLDLAD